MALGNNLKKVKKDSLIPKKGSTAEKKEERVERKPSAKSAKPKSTPKKSVGSNVKAAKPKADSKTATKPKKKAATKPKVTAAPEAPVVKAEASQPKSPERASVKERAAARVSKEASGPQMNPSYDDLFILGGDEDAQVNIRLQPSRRKKVKKTKMIMEGMLTLAHAEAIRDSLVSTLQDYDMIDISLQGVTQIDLAILQVLHAVKHHSDDKKITIDAVIPFDLKLVIDRAGFNELIFKQEAQA